MAGGGTGTPIHFMCWQARRERRAYEYSSPRYRPSHVVELTGRTRSNPSHNRHTRISGTVREYRCGCGHVGWSNHIDLERMEKRNS